MRASITTLNIDVGLLRKQRDTCLNILSYRTKAGTKYAEHLEGIINLLDEMVDLAEGYKKNIGEQYAYPTIKDYENCSKFKITNEAFRIGWDAARMKNKHLGIT